MKGKLFAGTLLVLCACFSACSKKAEKAAASNVSYDVKEPISIVWWHALEKQYDQTVADVVNGFNNSQNLVTVSAEYIGNYAAVNEALVAAHAAGTGLPGVCVANTPYVAEYGAGGLAEDLTPYIKATGFDIDDFGAGLVAASSYENKQVSLPFLISTQVMYYNKSMADKLGVTVPEKFSDMESFLKKVSKVNGGVTDVWGTIIPGWDQWYFETFFLNNGVKIITDKNKTDLDSPASVETIKAMNRWMENGTAYFAVGKDASSVMRQKFFENKAFSVLHTSSLYNTYVKNCNFEVGMAWFPAAETKKQEIGGCVLLIPAKNDQATKNASWQFLQYLCSKDVNMKWARETGYIPTRKSVLHTDEGVQFLKEKPAFKCIFDNLDLIEPRIQHKSWSQLAKIWMNSLAEMFIEKTDIDQSVKTMASEINEVLED